MTILSNEAIAWFFMGEGSATFTCCRRNEKKGLTSILGYRISPRIAFVNTDAEIILPIKEWLRFNKIRFITTIQDYSRSRNPRYLPLTIIRIERFKDAERLLEIILPYLLGKKRRVCELVLECLKKIGGRRDWSSLMREKVIRDKKTGRITGLSWDANQERRRFLEMMKYRDSVLSINGGLRAKYNYEHFANLWGIKT